MGIPWGGQSMGLMGTSVTGTGIGSNSHTNFCVCGVHFGRVTHGVDGYGNNGYSCGRHRTTHIIPEIFQAED